MGERKGRKVKTMKKKLEDLLWDIVMWLPEPGSKAAWCVLGTFWVAEVAVLAICIWLLLTR